MGGEREKKRDGAIILMMVYLFPCGVGPWKGRVSEGVMKQWEGRGRRKGKGQS